MSDTARKARRAARIHFSLAALWGLLIIPSMLWWKDSLLWVILMSQYANIAAHMSAGQAALADLHGQG